MDISDLKIAKNNDYKYISLISSGTKIILIAAPSINTIENCFSWRDSTVNYALFKLCTTVPREYSNKGLKIAAPLCGKKWRYKGNLCENVIGRWFTMISNFYRIVLSFWLFSLLFRQRKMSQRTISGNKSWKKMARKSLYSKYLITNKS